MFSRCGYGHLLLHWFDWVLYQVGATRLGKAWGEQWKSGRIKGASCQGRPACYGFAAPWRQRYDWKRGKIEWALAKVGYCPEDRRLVPGGTP